MFSMTMCALQNINMPMHVLYIHSRGVYGVIIQIMGRMGRILALVPGLGLLLDFGLSLFFVATHGDGSG